MADFSWNTETQNSSFICRFSGPIDENATFPAYDDLVGSELIFDFNDVSLINSIGIKSWIQWVSPLAASKKIIFDRCPKSIILQINMVRNFLPDGAKVKSFYLPMFCDDCEEETNILVDADKDLKVDGGKVTLLETVFEQLGVCDATGERCAAEPDVIEKKYFRFLD